MIDRTGSQQSQQFSSDVSHTVRVERLVDGGDALVRAESGVVFVSGALPGELVELGPVQRRGKRMEAELLRVIEASPDRRDPRCRHAGVCGGCHWQHLDYAAQQTWKRRILAENLRRLGGIAVEPATIGLVSGPEWGYRNRVQAHSDADGRRGFRQRRSADLVDVEECPVLVPDLERAMLTTADQPGERQVLFRDDTAVRTGGRDPVAEVTVDGRRVRFDPAGFAQSNRGLLPQLAAHLQRVVKPGMLADLYAGAGLLVTLALTDRPPRNVVCVEPERRNAQWISTNLQNQGLDIRRLRVEETTVERALRRGVGRTLVEQEGTILLDPPRRGLSRELRRWLTTAPRRTARLVYLSCDAAALARDLGELKDYYHLVELTVFDFYPQTAHIETLAILDPS